MKFTLVFGLFLVGISSWAGSPCQISTPVQGSCEAMIQQLHPTQLTVGLIEVREKEAHIRSLMVKPTQFQQFQKDHMIPTVIGPQGKLYIIDHHHLVRSYDDVGVQSVICTIVQNFSDQTEDQFWQTMVTRNWVYPYDENGKGPLAIADLPDTVLGLKDDPYRALTHEVELQGAITKTDIPFVEFTWSNFFRSRVNLGSTDADFHAAVPDAVKLARSNDAAGLPGYLATPHVE